VGRSQEERKEGVKMVIVPSELVECFENRSIADIKALVKWLFPKIKAAQNITDTQAYIIKRVAFSEVRRLSISAYTRYGKTQTIAIAAALYILLNENKKIKFIGPSTDPAGILRNYMTELILNSKGGILLNLADLDRSGYERIKKEASRNRMTFKNGCEYRVISAHGGGFAAMGHGGDLICVPEDTLIDTTRGRLKIKDIVESDSDVEVLSYNHQKNVIEYKPILKTFKRKATRLLRLYSNEEYIECTENHPVFVLTKGYISAKKVGFLDKILALNKGQVVEKFITKIERLPEQQIDVYNLEVTDNNNYFANGVLVHNCMDEAALISREAYAKITRMLGDDPENSTLIELYNPWSRNTKAFDHSINPNFERIQITWRDGVREGRTTEEFIMEQKKDITPIEFTVLYESEFPEESEDSLHLLKSINNAETISFGFESEIQDLIKQISMVTDEFERKRLSKELGRYTKIIACDPADRGLDFSVIIWGIAKDNQYFEVKGIYSENKTESMNLVGKIIQKAKEFIGKNINGEIKIDKIGIGTGAESRLQEIILEEHLDNIKVIGCHYGESAIKKDIYANKKAENNFRLKQLLEENKISLKAIANNPDYYKLKAELLAMRWEITSSEKKRILDPDKSPDYNDALVYLVWKDRQDDEIIITGLKGSKKFDMNNLTDRIEFYKKNQ